MRRRDFIKVGTGILIAARLDLTSAFARGQMPYPTDYRAYFHFGNDGRVTCFVGRIEMGQGNTTSLAQIVADELGVDLGAIDMVMGDTAKCPWDLGTFGSMSIAVFGPVLRQAAADARKVLLEVAPATRITTARVVGESVPRKDALDKITGRALFAGDIRLPGMLYARLLRPPSHGATLRHVDTTAAERIAGIRVVHRDDLVAVLHEHPDVAATDNGVMTVWASTQAPFIVRRQVAAALGLAPDQVRIVTPFVGGGFGGKTAGQQAVEAARLSQLTGRPVQVGWDRAEEFFFDTFRPAALITIASAIDRAGRIVLWDADVIGAGEGGAVPVYDIPNKRVIVRGGWQTPPPGLHPFGVGAWRAPAMNSNTFAREIQMDTMAAAAGIDPLAFRLNHLSDDRVRRVLDAVARRFGWSPSRSKGTTGVGVACGIYSSTYVATMGEVSVDRGSGGIRVNRVVCGQDMGQAVNPNGARAQIEGCITMGLGYALGERVRFKDGAILDRNFDTYELPRFSALPAIETVLVSSPGARPSAGGEPAIICMGAVIANAVHNVVGAWPHELPMTPAYVRRLT